MSAVTADRPGPILAANDPTTLGGALRFIARTPIPWLLPTYIVAGLATRIWLGHWTWADAVIAGVIIGGHPFTEWFAHVFLLHFKPRKVLGVTIDLPMAKEHRLHHEDPKFFTHGWPLLLRLLIGIPLGAALLVAVLPATPQVVTGITAAILMFLLYEWTHFLIHTAYPPKSNYYRSIWRAHRLHHFRNEHYWFGGTSNFADHVLGTFPDKADVEMSPTVRSLVRQPD